RMPPKPMSPEQLFNSLTIATRGTLSNVERFRRSQSWHMVIRNVYGNEPDGAARMRNQIHWILTMINGADLNEAVSNLRPTVAELIKDKGPRVIMDEVFLTVLSRHGTDDEYRRISDKMKTRIGDKDPLDPWRDLFWALLNSNEFVLNH